jgi:hypothetical protein
METVLLVLIALVALATGGYFGFKWFKLNQRFAPVISIEAECDRAKAEVLKAKGRASQLEANYHMAKEVYDRVLAETALLQEDLEDMSFGLYAPHYTFETAEQFKLALDAIYDEKKALIKADGAADYPTNWTVNNNKKDGARMIKNQVKLMLRAFNGECDAAIAKVTWNNVVRMEERIRKAHEAITALGVIHQIQINPAYLVLCLKELRLSYEYEVKRQEEKEEQRAIRERMREEEKVQREIERAQREAALEKEKLEKALAAATAELQKASGEHLVAIQQQIEDLAQKMVEIEAKREHIASMAEITRMGHLYVISNLGSFGEDVYKIGMTRRLDPVDRIQELSGASVPFEYDIHAMVFSKDAPALENALHRKFATNRLNLVNMRKEFFRVSLDEIEAFAQSRGANVEFTKLAAARQYRESQSLREKAAKAGLPPEPKGELFPDELFTEVAED